MVCNPNNPTGAILSDAERRGIVDAAARHGSWILADEVYRGAEREGPETPSFWGAYDRVLATCGLSKAYGLPGLRIGWIVAPSGSTWELWGRKDYTSISPGALSDFLAQKALVPATRARILERTRGILRENYPVLEAWTAKRRDAFRMVAPRAGAIAYLRYLWKVNSTELVLRLRDEQSVLIVPGDHFGMDGFLRVGYGNEPHELTRRAQAHRRDPGRARAGVKPKLRIAFVGFGHVGRRFADLLRGPFGRALRPPGSRRPSPASRPPGTASRSTARGLSATRAAALTRRGQAARGPAPRTRPSAPSPTSFARFRPTCWSRSRPSTLAAANRPRATWLRRSAAAFTS